MNRPPPDIEPLAAASILASAERLRVGARGFLLGLIIGGFIVWAGAAGAETIDGRSVHVIDGDTVRLASGETIRIRNIDAPETARAKCEAEAALGHRAKARLAQLLREGELRISRCEPPPQDAFRGGAPLKAWRCQDIYERTLATIEAGGRDVGETLIAEGLATRWPRRFDGCGFRK